MILTRDELRDLTERERTPDVIDAERQILRAMRDRERLFVRAGWRVRPRHDPDAR